MQAIANKENIGQGQEDFESEHLALLKSIPAGDMIKDDGILMLAAADKAQHRTISYMLQETDQWPKDVLKQAALCASSKGYDMTMRAILNGMPDMDGAFFQKLLDGAADSDMRSTLNASAKKRSVKAGALMMITKSSAKRNIRLWYMSSISVPAM